MPDKKHPPSPRDVAIRKGFRPEIVTEMRSRGVLDWLPTSGPGKKHPMQPDEEQALETFLDLMSAGMKPAKAGRIASAFFRSQDDAVRYGIGFGIWIEIPKAKPPAA